MAYYRTSPQPRRPKNELVVCVGWRAFVNWSPPKGQPHSQVPITDDGGKPLGNDLADGQEVEILSWRPRSRAGLLYQVRRLSDGSEWWVAATYLRRGAIASPAAAESAVAATGGGA